MERPEIPERLRAFIAERTALDTEMIDAVLLAEQAFFSEQYPELHTRAVEMLMEADDNDRERPA